MTVNDAFTNGNFFTDSVRVSSFTNTRFDRNDGLVSDSISFTLTNTSTTVFVDQMLVELTADTEVFAELEATLEGLSQFDANASVRGAVFPKPLGRFSGR